jgi:sulfatase maturation enzyme AslB (radical SAM superfamily)
VLGVMIEKVIWRWLLFWFPLNPLPDISDFIRTRAWIKTNGPTTGDYQEHGQAEYGIAQGVCMSIVGDVLLHRQFPQTAYRVLRWHIKYCLRRPAPPLACGFYITSRCNFRCVFCNIWRIQPGFQTPRQEAERIIGDLAGKGLSYLSFSGGEPLLVPYVFDLLAYAKERGILYTHLVSNGYLMDAEKARKLRDARVSEISLSLDGDESSHDRGRGIKGAYRGVLAAVERVLANAPDTKIVLNAILDPRNPANALAAVRTAETLGVRIKLQPANVHPSFGFSDTAGVSREPPDDGQWETLRRALAELRSSRHVTNSRAFLDNYEAFLFSPEAVLFAREDCLFGYHHVEFFGNRMFPCAEGMGWQNGFDVAGKTIGEVMNSPEYLSLLAKLRRCAGCSKNYYVCYYEPRLNFPIWNFVRSRFLGRPREGTRGL